MLQITFENKIFISTRAVDFRMGIDGLVASCWSILQLDPRSGHAFVFRNRKGTSIKILTYTGKGFWLCQKRLSYGRFKHWPHTPEQASAISPEQILCLLN